ncbi:Fopnl [Bugula neritina]|uniref:Fopnl n=1 Tax=Bugula neritina TaxID=10212 RepID=A0A7J7J1N9_BUGNE|nr:Fopnl [Bugula neritina]
MAQIEELRSALADVLEKRGILESVRGRIRSEIFNALDCKDVAKPKPNNDTILINELIREYLEYNNYKYTASTLKSESGQSDLPLSRDFIESELHVKTMRQSRKLPLLYTLINDFSQRGKISDQKNSNMASSRTGQADDEMHSYSKSYLEDE